MVFIRYTPMKHDTRDKMGFENAGTTACYNCCRILSEHPDDSDLSFNHSIIVM